MKVENWLRTAGGQKVPAAREGMVKSFQRGYSHVSQFGWENVG